MKISLYLNVLLLALMMTIVTANVRLQRSPQQYCGSRLADIMKVICKSNYNGPNLRKRSQIDSDVWDYKDLEDYNAIDYPYLPKKEAMSFMPSRLLRSFKRSIIDECCNRPCYLSELKTYCGSH
ncbi:bombyxin C-2-like [Acyrthosiphon pisum]|uniref:Insulin-like domain-containing protein n=1 Tax=Acyrthosiphon pisum TaxID=7029 RepID=A0A8R2A789_ACYPI|nr:bombyxin C-2-like [Acyrthosiphon pisum]|eukprot:XP_003240930.1 PREDICTED: bombyxin C-2-like [Acyrthosiphon pisum]